MQEAFRTARPRRVAVLATIGLALAGGTIGACVDLHARAETARDAQISLLHLSGDVATMQTLPRTVQNARSLADRSHAAERPWRTHPGGVRLS